MNVTVWIRRYGTAGSAKLSSLPHKATNATAILSVLKCPWFPGSQPEVTFVFRQHNLCFFFRFALGTEFVYWMSVR